MLAFFSSMTRITLQAQSAKHADAQPVAMWCGSEDELTRKVCDAADRAFRAAKDLPLITTQERAMYTVTIAPNVTWKIAGKQVQIFYTVNLKSAEDKDLGTFNGSCWESKVKECGTQILETTREKVRGTKTDKGE